MRRVAPASAKAITAAGLVAFVLVVGSYPVFHAIRGPKVSAIKIRKCVSEVRSGIDHRNRLKRR